MVPPTGGTMGIGRPVNLNGVGIPPKTHYPARANTGCLVSPIYAYGVMYARRDSNPQHSGLESDTSTDWVTRARLRRLSAIVPQLGFEPRLHTEHAPKACAAASYAIGARSDGTREIAPPDTKQLYRVIRGLSSPRIFHCRVPFPRLPLDRRR